MNLGNTITLGGETMTIGQLKAETRGVMRSAIVGCPESFLIEGGDPDKLVSLSLSPARKPKLSKREKLRDERDKRRQLQSNRAQLLADIIDPTAVDQGIDIETQCISNGVDPVGDDIQLQKQMSTFCKLMEVDFDE